MLEVTHVHSDINKKCFKGSTTLSIPLHDTLYVYVAEKDKVYIDGPCELLIRRSIDKLLAKHFL